MQISTNGKVGIGTTSPTGLLHIYGTDAAFRIQNNGTGNMQFGQWDTINNRIQSSGRDFLLTQTDSFNMLFHTNSTERMRITSGGNVGIGTSSPAAKLTVSGTQVETHINNGDTNTLALGGFSGGRHFIKSINLGVALTPLTLQASSFTFDTGNVGIGTTSPSYPLHVSGSSGGISIYATNDIAAFSDESVKTELQIIDNAIDRIKQINGYTYVRIDDLSNIRRAGVIAQEVQKVLPEVVSENNDGTLNVAYSNMVALLIEGMKEQQSQIDELKQRLDNL